MGKIRSPIVVYCMLVFMQGIVWTASIRTVAQDQLQPQQQVSKEITSRLTLVFVCDTSFGQNNKNNNNNENKNINDIQEEKDKSKDEADVVGNEDNNNGDADSDDDSDDVKDWIEMMNVKYLDLMKKITQEFVPLSKLLLSVLSYSDESIKYLVEPQFVNSNNVNNVVATLTSSLIQTPQRNLPFLGGIHGAGTAGNRMGPMWGLNQAVNLLIKNPNISDRNSTVVIVWLLDTPLSERDLRDDLKNLNSFIKNSNWNLIIVPYVSFTTTSSASTGLQVFDRHRVFEINAKIKSLLLATKNHQK